MTTHSITATGYSQTTTVGGYITFPAISGNYARIPDAANLDIVGDICIVARIRPVDATPSAAQAIVSKLNSDPNRSYLFRLNTTGGLIWAWTTAGTAATQLSAATGAPPNAATNDGQWQWHAFTFDVDDGAGNRVSRGWYSPDGGVSWVLTTTVTTAGTTSIFSGSNNVHFGSDVGGVGLLYAGDIGYVSIRDGIGASGVVGGTEVFRFDGAVDTYGVASGASSIVASTGQTITVFHSGGTPAVIVPVVPGAAVEIMMPLTSTGTGASTGSATLGVSMPLTSTGTDTSTGSATLTFTATITATGDGTSTGTAAMLTAATLTAAGTGTSTGSAAAGIDMPVTAAGTGSSTGSAAYALGVPLTATGAGTSTGSAAFILAMPLTAAGAGTSTGSAAMLTAATLSAAGTDTSTGSAATLVTATLSAAGAGQSTGSASFGASTQLAATGVGQSTGSATLTFTATITATGVGQSTGSATLVRALLLAATGVGQSTGSATLVRALLLTAAGAGTSSGDAALLTTVTLTATGVGSSIGTATPQMTMSLSATGTGQSVGSAVFVRRVAGGSSTGTTTVPYSTGVIAANGSVGTITLMATSVGTIAPPEDS